MTTPLAAAPASAEPRPTLEPLPGWVRWLVGLTALGRVLYLFLQPLGLSPDEAYYWDWTRQLDWCYYSKPPMVAWLIWGSTQLLGDAAWAVRLPAALAIGGTHLLLVLTARRAFGAKAAQFAALLFLAAPATTFAGLVMTIDPPTFFFWSLALYGLMRAVQEDRRRWWWLAGVAAGLTVLTKQVGLGLPVLTVLSFVVAGSAPKRPLAAMVALVVPVALALVPVLEWNLRHQFITFVHTAEHFGKAEGSLLGNLADFGAFAGAQLGVAGFLAYPALLVGVWAWGFGYWQLRRPAQVLFFLGALPYLGVHFLSLLQRTQPNWPAPLLLAGLLLLAGALAGQLWPPPAGAAPSSAWAGLLRWVPAPVTGAWSAAARWGQRWSWAGWLGWPYRVAAGLGVALALVLLAWPWLSEATGVAGSRQDLARRLRGWPELAAAVEARWQAEGLDWQRDLLICGTERGPVSALAYYLEAQPKVYRWNQGGVIDSQHEIWGGPPELKRGANALLLLRDATPEHLARIEAAFESYELRPALEVPMAGRPWLSLAVVIGRGFRTWEPFVPTKGAVAGGD